MTTTTVHDAKTLRQFAHRAKVIRAYLGKTTRELAAELGIKHNSWTQYELADINGRGITMGVAIALAEKFDISTDYTLRGVTKYMDPKLAAALEKVSSELTRKSA